MSLTKFEALQLAALLATRREYANDGKADVKELFDLAELILQEDKSRSQRKTQHQSISV